MRFFITFSFYFLKGKAFSVCINNKTVGYMTKVYLLLLSIYFLSITTVVAQDSIKKAAPQSAGVVAQDSIKKGAPQPADTLKKSIVPGSSKTNVPDTTVKRGSTIDAGIGVAVSPSTLRFNLKPGNAQTKTIKVTNDTKVAKKFNVTVQEFRASELGKPVYSKIGESKFGLAKWLNISPSYIELRAGEKKNINVQLDIPDVDSAAIAGWVIIAIDEVRDRAPLDQSSTNKNTLALGIVPSIGFGVYVFQNPPEVNNHNVEITSFKYNETGNKRIVEMECKNIGNGIGFCSNYLELINLTTGEQTKLPIKQVTILPGFVRKFYFELSSTLKPGKYSAAGVLDFGSKEYVQTAELEFLIQ